MPEKVLKLAPLSLLESGQAQPRIPLEDEAAPGFVIGGIGSKEIDLHALQLFCTIVRQRLDAFAFHTPLMLFSEECAKFRACGEKSGAVSDLDFKASLTFAENIVEKPISRAARAPIG